MVATVQRIGGDEIRRFPVTTLDEAVALQAGAVGESYRGGRLGQQSFVLDGLGVKNQLDASSGPLGVRIPPDLLTEASLTTNGFSARYGQAISGLVNVVTKDGGDHWNGRAAYESDRLLPGSADFGQDRVIVSADGPLPRGAGFVAVFDAEGRLDAHPVNAPPSPDARDPRNASPLLPHNSGERYDAAAKLRIPLGGPHTLRLFALRSVDQRLLFDPAYKYATPDAPARRVTGDLLSAHFQRATNALTADVRAGYFAREFTRGALTAQPDYRFGAFSGSTFHFVGEELARSQDTARARRGLQCARLERSVAVGCTGVLPRRRAERRNRVEPVSRAAGTGGLQHGWAVRGLLLRRRDLAATRSHVRARARLPARRQERPARHRRRFQPDLRRGVRRGTTPRLGLRGDVRRPVRSIRSRQRRAGDARRRAALAQSAARVFDRAEGRDVRGELGAVLAGARLSVSR